MALINKIRQKSGLAIFLVALGLIAFLVGGDLLSPNSALFGSTDNSVGTVNGTKVDQNTLKTEIDYLLSNYQANSPNPVSESQKEALKGEAWNRIIFDLAYVPSFTDLGVLVTKRERDDMLAGNNIHPQLKQSFVDPQTGQFSREQLVNFIQTFERETPPEGMDAREFMDRKNSWMAFRTQIPEGRLQQKYSNLLAKSSYVTKAEAERNYKGASTVANIKYAYVPFYTIADSTVEVTDAALNAYLTKNAKKFETEGTRSFDYAVFKISPSAEDTAAVMQEVAEIKEEFIGSVNDTLFVNQYSDNPVTPSKMLLANLPRALQTMALDSGVISDPVQEGGQIVVYKITNIVEDTSFSVKASHILVKWDSDTDEDKAIAKRNARSILDSIRGGADFAEMSIRHSKDFGSGSRGGDLGWFGEGQMVPTFNDAVFAKEGKGLINEIIESQFGYHLIKVTEPKSNDSYIVSKISRQVFAGEETKDRIYREVNDFMTGITTSEAFSAKADSAKGFTKYSSGNVGSMDPRLPGLQKGRSVIQWAFSEADEEEVSKVLTLDEAYVVAALTKVVPKGTKDLESVREEVALKVRNEMKAKQIIEKLDLTKSMEEMATSYGKDATVKSLNAVNLLTSSMDGVGIEPVAIGASFALKNGEKSKAIIGDNGVLVVEMAALTEPAAKDNFDAEKATLLQNAATKAGGAAFQALKELTEIEDNRYRYY